jgi:hypothetical protein
MNPSSTFPQLVPCSGGAVTRYEALRQEALGRSGRIPRGQGLALLMRSGMRTWMQAWAQCAVEAPAPPQEPLGDEEMLPLGMRQDVTMILAGMVLCGHQEARV